MAARTGTEYISGLRADGREVWLGAERVRDVTAHPAFAGSLRGMAGFFDWQHRHAEDCIATGPDPDRPVGIAHVIPRGPEDLARRHRGLETLARYSAGMLGRTPDYVSLTFAGFAGQPSVWSASGNARGAGNLIAFQRQVAEKDLALTHTIIHPVVDGGAAPYEGVNREVALRKVGETAGGIVVRGARILATLGPFADELAVYPGQPIPKDAADVALAFSIPLATPGLRIICRDHYGLDADPFDKPFSSRFDEQDAFVVFDDVEVPRHRVFLDGDPATYNAVMARGWVGNVMQQTSIRAMVKLSSPTSSAAAWPTPRPGPPAGGHADAGARSGATPSSPAPPSVPRRPMPTSSGTGYGSATRRRSGRYAHPAGMDAAGERDHQAHRLAQPPGHALAEAGSTPPSCGPGWTGTCRAPETPAPRSGSRLFRTAWDFAGSALGARAELYERYYLASAARTYTLAHVAARKDREWEQVPAFWEHLDASGRT